MKMDIRTRYTKNIIKEVFCNLLKKNPLSRVTVTKICNNAEINRSTFYKYYTDPYDLMQQLEDETLEDLSILAESANNKSIENILYLILSEILEKREYFHCLFYKQDTHSFNEKLLLLCCSIAYPQINIRKRFPSLKEQEWFYYFMIQGSSYILDKWIYDGMQDNISQIAGFMGKIHHELMMD